jgi:flagellar hook-length control protein FliK
MAQGSLFGLLSWPQAAAGAQDDAHSPPWPEPKASVGTSTSGPSSRESGWIMALPGRIPVADDLLPMSATAPSPSKKGASAPSATQDVSAEMAVASIAPSLLDPMADAFEGASGAPQPAPQVLASVPDIRAIASEDDQILLAPDSTQRSLPAQTESAAAGHAASPAGMVLERVSPLEHASAHALGGPSAGGPPASLEVWPGEERRSDAAPAADQDRPSSDRATKGPVTDQTMPAVRAAESRPVERVAMTPALLADLAGTSSGGEILPSAQGIDGTGSSYPTGGLLHAARAERAAVLPVHDQVALHVSKALEDGRTEIRIHLRPTDLGDVDIRLEFHDLRLTATVSADRPETLDLLQRDARGLTRAFREAGVDIDQSALSFAHGGRGGHSGDRPGDEQAPPMIAGASEEQRGLPMQAQVAHRGLLALWDGRVDVLV